MYPLYFMNGENEDTDPCKKKSPKLQTGTSREELIFSLLFKDRVWLGQGLSVLVLVTFRQRCDRPVLCLVRHSVLGPYLHIVKSTISQAVRTKKCLQTLNVLHVTQFLVEKREAVFRLWWNRNAVRNVTGSLFLETRRVAVQDNCCSIHSHRCLG